MKLGYAYDVKEYMDLNREYYAVSNIDDDLYVFISLTIEDEVECFDYEDINEFPMGVGMYELGYYESYIQKFALQEHSIHGKPLYRD